MKRLFTIKTLYIACFGLALLLLSEGHMLSGVAFVLGGLCLRLESKVDSLRHNAESIERPVTIEDIPDKDTTDDEEPFYLNMAKSRLESEHGWDRISVYPSLGRYEREYCFGGPPTYTEVWEYEVKDSVVVFERLIDRYIDDIYEDHLYEVVNGCLQQDMMDRKNVEEKTWVPYSADCIAGYKREIVWHEMHGALMYFLLSKHHPSRGWERRVVRFQKSVAELSTKAEALGATCNRFGNYELPKEADATDHKKLEDLFSVQTLLKKYGIRSYQEWVERDQITALLDP